MGDDQGELSKGTVQPHTVVHCLATGGKYPDIWRVGEPGMYPSISMIWPAIAIVVGRVRAAARHEPKQQANAGRNHAV